MRSARAPSPPMEGPAADPAADLVDRDAEALEEALVELRMDMVQLLLLLVQVPRQECNNVARQVPRQECSNG